MGINIVTYYLDTIYVSLDAAMARKADEKFRVFDELRRFLYLHLKKRFGDMFDSEEIVQVVDRISSLYDISNISNETLKTGKVFYTLKPRYDDYRIAIKRDVSILTDRGPFEMEAIRWDS